MYNLIGIEKVKADALIVELNDLLANYQMFYQNLRGFHWNIKGKEFFDFYLKYEEIYNDAVIKVDEIAERILTLDGTPLHTFEDYINQSTIEVAKGLFDGKTSVNMVMANFSILLQKERLILNLAGDANDEGTVSLMSDYISQTEKILWMLKSYLG